MDAGKDQSFGELLRAHRVSAGLSQEELAERAHLSRRTVSDLERGVATAPYRHTVGQLTEALGLSEADSAALEATVRRARAPRRPSPGQVYPLLETKLTVPPARADFLPRPRLIQQIEAGLRGALTLLSAPAGSGKTTLLSAWRASPPARCRPVAWVSLDAGDNDPARFWRYVLTALARSAPGAGASALSLLDSFPPPPTEAVLTALLNGLRAAGQDVVLALEDYHLIVAEPIHRALAFLLERRPAGLHLLIATRVDPPLPLARLRARGEVAELRAADLRFTLEEASAFLGDVMRLSLSAEEVEALEARTEGWVAGLQLAALSLRGREDVSAFVASFSGGHRHVLDYLAEEVLDRQSGHVRGFLLETSVLGRLTGALCDAVTGHGDGRELLERLERENLFVVPLDEERRWYRFHHLFGECLRTRLEGERPERIKELHRLAALWYEREGPASEAVRHALAAGDDDRAADLIERVVGETWARGELLTLLGWLEALPERAKQGRPRLLLEHATALMVVGRPDAVEPLLREAEGAVGCDGEASTDQPGAGGGVRRRSVLGYAAAVRSWRANLLGDPREAGRLARRALDLLSARELRPRTIAALTLAAAHREADDVAAASAAFAEGCDLAWAAGNLYAASQAMARHAELQMTRGRLREAAAIIRRALRLADERGGAALLATGEVHVAMGMLLYEWDDLDGATRWLTEGLELGSEVRYVVTGQSTRVSALVDGYVALSQAKMARGDAAGSFQAALEAERRAQDSIVPQATVKAAAWKARLHLARGDLAAAASEQQRAADAGATWIAAREAEQTASARLLIARGEPSKALRLLEELREAAEAAGRTGSLIQVLAIEALALRAQGEKRKAVSTLARALSLAEPAGYVRTFADEGPPMAALLSEVLESLLSRQHAILPDLVPTHYVRRLLAVLGRDASRATRLPERLTGRELEVLALVATGMANSAIAHELHVGVNTVKTHLKSAYGKLGVHSREQAVYLARELALL